MLVGGNPFATTSIYSFIHYLERKWGVYFCMGGTGAIVDALTRLMQRHGIKVLTGADVSQINMTDKKVSGVTLDEVQELVSDHVICNADPPVVYQEMLKKAVD